MTDKRTSKVEEVEANPEAYILLGYEKGFSIKILLKLRQKFPLLTIMN